jgi:hypothetical protein
MPRRLSPHETGDIDAMTPLPRTVYGPPDREETSLEDWLEN